MLLVGFDFGSTTSSAMLAEAKVLRNCVTGRMELGELATVYRGEPVFTPFVGEDLDEACLADQLDAWLAASGAKAEEIHSGGAIVTGLAARAANAAVVGRLVRDRLGEALVATADDPGLESWLAFMGNCLALARAEPRATLLNFDIGGGTTNLAWGRGGEVQQIGCYYLGARHVQLAPETYCITQLSSFAERLLPELDISGEVGHELSPGELNRLLDFYLDMFEALVGGPARILESELAKFHEQIPFTPPDDASPVITFSGGVGELVYRCAAGQPLHPTTDYGDLGIDLAERIVASPRLSRSLRTHVPENLGRATVYGLTIHNTELSGTTLYLPRPEILPLCDLPVVGRLAWSSEPAEAAVFAEQLRGALLLACRSSSGACLSLECASQRQQAVAELGRLISQACQEVRYPAERPLVLLVSSNIGQTLGQYATGWGQAALNLIVLDEVPDRRAHFVTLGRPSNNLVPLSFYGMHNALSSWQGDDLP